MELLSFGNRRRVDFADPVLTQIVRDDNLRALLFWKFIAWLLNPTFDGDDRLPAVPCVLIVDQSAESRDVLRTILESRGAATLEADRPEQAIPLATRFRPDLIVLDADSDQSAGVATENLRAVAGRTDTPIVILGTLRRPQGQLPPGQIVAKPYHYGQLLRKIDDLLAAA